MTGALKWKELSTAGKVSRVEGVFSSTANMVVGGINTRNSIKNLQSSNQIDRGNDVFYQVPTTNDQTNKSTDALLQQQLQADINTKKIMSAAIINKMAQDKRAKDYKPKTENTMVYVAGAVAVFCLILISRK